MQNFPLPDLVIPNAGTTAPGLVDIRALGNADAITIYGPAALTNAVKVEVAPSSSDTDGDYCQHQEVIGTDTTIAAGKSITIRAGGFGSLRVKSAGAEGAARTFKVVAHMWR